MLTFNAKDKCFTLITTEVERAKKDGLTESTRARGPNGEPVFYTATVQRGERKKPPLFNPYAVLSYWDEADAKAKEQLAPYKADYDQSWSERSDFKVPKPAWQHHDYMPFQRAGIEFAVKHGSTLVADEPGLGKTATSIGVANVIGAKRVLAIVPASIRLNWQREIRNWSTIQGLTTHPILKAKNGFKEFDNWVIPSYEMARNNEIHARICEHNWDLLILDEAHMLKTTDALRTRAIFGQARGEYSAKHISKKCGQILALTGTPLLNRPRECFTLAKALNWESIDWDTYDDFLWRYNPSSSFAEDGYVDEKTGRLSELQARLRCNFMIRRLKKDVQKDLPDKRYELSYIEPNGAIKDVLAKERLIDFNLDDLKNPFAEIWGMVSTIRREMGEAKIPRVVEHMKFLLDVMELPKVILFCHHRSVMDNLAVQLVSYGVVQVRGGVGAQAKNDRVQKFIHDPKTRIFMGQLEAAGFGIDGLQGVCSHVVIAEPAWTSATNEQAIDRAHRMGQHSNVLAQFLVVEGSLDELILGKVLQKAHMINDSLDRRF